MGTSCPLKSNKRKKQRRIQTAKIYVNTKKTQGHFPLLKKEQSSDKIRETVNGYEFLHQMLLHHPRRHLIVVMDQASPHISKITRKYIESQKRLHVFYLPPYSPDWNPDEKVWNHLKCQELKSHQAKTNEESSSKDK